MADWQHQTRIDLSSWIIHFVHERTPETSFEVQLNEMAEEAELNGCTIDRSELQFPDYYTAPNNPISIFDQSFNDDWELDNNATAFEVIQRIIHDGFIRSGWSFRNTVPTVYGPYSAICFTEMPLYALIDYANKRQSGSKFVGKYGIAFKKNELFMAGARNVIYGLSGEHKESEEGDPYWGYGLRTLASSCGLGINEQYRYVYTKLSHDKPIDWTFEREWRLPVKDDHWGVPGLPFLLDRSIYNNPIKDAFVIVETDEEKDIILEQLANMYNSKATNYGYEYDLEMLLRIGVVSIEELSKHDSFTQIKIDDITKTHFSKLKLKDVNDEVYSNIDKALEIAGSVFDTEYEKQLVNYGGDTYSYPISHMKLCTDDYTEITQGMMNKGIACCFGEGRYYIEINRPFTGNESFGYDVMRVVADAISDFLGQKFYAFAIPD